MHRKNKRGYVVPKSKIAGSTRCCEPFYGGYYFDKDKQRIVRLYASSVHKFARKKANKKIRSKSKQAIIYGYYYLEEEGSAYKKAYSMWFWS